MNAVICLVTLFVLLRAPVWSAEQFEKITKEVRESYLQRAQVWRATEVSQMNILAGPQNEISVPPGTQVTCTYVEPKGEGLVGAVPKFLCKLPSGETVRVKFGGNREMFAEVVGSRLFWALGFYADEVYPVRLKCIRCPAKDVVNPAKNESRVERTFESATIERDFPGIPIEEQEDQGWNWKELDLVDAKMGGAPRSHIDAIKLLAVFIQHADSKPDNQRLACYEPDVVDPDKDGTAACAKPVMMIQDLGSTFGSGTDVLRTSKMDLGDWNEQEIWNLQAEGRYLSEKGQPICYGNITSSRLAGESGLDTPVISEEGRQFLAGLLNQLSDRQIEDLFRVAQIEQLEEFIEEDGKKRRSTPADWAKVFKEKRQQINERTCPD